MRIRSLQFDLWLPMTMWGQLTHTGTWMLNDRNTRNFMMMARLKPGVTVEQARLETRALAGRMAVLDADTNQGIGAEVLPLWKGDFTAQAVILKPMAILSAAGEFARRFFGGRDPIGARFAAGANGSRWSE